MDERFSELESIALAARAKKGRMDGASREKASALLASILSDATVDPSPSLQLLEDIKAEAIAEALRSCWPNMELARRNAFRKWVPAPTTERSYRRLAYLAASVLESDSATALEWLGLLIPQGRKNLGKESRETLASALFDERVLSFDTLVGGTANIPELLRICATLFEIAADPTFGAPAMTRARLASAILNYLTRPDVPKDGPAISDLKSKIIADAKRWPLALRDQFVPGIGERPIAPPDSRPVNPVASAKPPSEAIPGSGGPTTPTVISGSLREELPRLEGQLNSRISALTREVELLRCDRDHISQLARAAEDVEVQCETTRRELEHVQQSLRLAASERDRAKADSTRAMQHATELATALEGLKTDTEGERKRLAQQISANATGRIEEFKKRLGLNLSRLVVDLPGRDTLVTADLGKILLLQFHQFLEALRQEGIEMRIGA